MFLIKSEEFDIESYKKALRLDECGGYCSFEGWVRNHNNDNQVRGLEYSAYEELAVATGEKIVAKAKELFDIEEAICIHRVGKLAIGDLAVWVGVSAKHRGATFEACQYIINTLKADVPIWKKEFYLDKETHEWVSNIESRP
ncbi:MULTISPECIES: molybdenum cofactor biosynthesis protein MoaE [Pasteurellaceae]|uniref:Molybdenum cofactor biosynthesis protein MoaE n=3 Tax=Pasteurellaceae TaxID=712 RepID=A0ACC6HML1_9PAST|nr:molybdenum cofactor biosynthesis protein MoaE [Pasteurella atlantica]MBR0573179.1 molybdenum cofactor biosynthesis protein MoaE [Pasteurella atlantica]MDP8039205.1 molybdenum cofactor biosynthesis protein MoaE [Pasteurella atlantica]MDP8041196.1 molybdenum cofactor biosynthesis protein MoaE [Pasteurella atlantica]MDP8043333.1 molybdenum cofactor biosynthesis protein MoaE [Pasteurella atlantica]MDP8045419.1 molybdenum cofactor biosynthesis protein MoaE [Pasteurella atlantica]